MVPEGYNVTGLVRRKEHADGIKASGAIPLMGDLDNKDLITKQTEASDIVFHTATADHVQSAEAILAGVQARSGKGQSTIYIHTSGTAVLDDQSDGEFRLRNLHWLGDLSKYSVPWNRHRVPKLRDKFG